MPRARADRHLSAKPLPEARAALLEAARRSEASEIIAVEDALGRVTASAVMARRSVPHYHGAAMDGIAVRAADTTGASEEHPAALERGTPETALRPFAYVDTGNALPAWADAVVMIERVSERATSSQVTVSAVAARWQHVRLVGEDVIASEPLVPRGHRLGPFDIGALLAAGVTEVTVRPRPRVAILPTGDELSEPGEELLPGRIAEFNSRMIAACVREWGGEPTRLAPVGDSLASIRARLESALAEADVVCVIAGSSAGRHDFTVEALAGIGEILAQGIDVVPGRPAILTAVDAKPERRARVVIGVPGYPVSAAVVCREILEPLLAHLLGAPPPDRVTVRAAVVQSMRSRLGVEELVRVTLGKVGDRVIATPLGRGAGAISTMMKADGLVRIPVSADAVQAGEEVDVELLRPLRDVLGTIVVTGSHDRALAILEDALRARRPEYKLAIHLQGSLDGLQALARAEAHVAAGGWIEPAEGRVVQIHLLARQHGLIVAPGNPLRLRGIADLASEKVRFANRPPGSGTRARLERLLLKEGVDPARIDGFERAVPTHMAVAAAVQSGLADAGLGTESAAAALGLDFLPLGVEDFDLALRADFAASEPGRALVEVIRSPPFREALGRLPGCDSSRTGEEK